MPSLNNPPLQYPNYEDLLSIDWKRDQIGQVYGKCYELSIYPMDDCILLYLTDEDGEEEEIEVDFTIRCDNPDGYIEDIWDYLQEYYEDNNIKPRAA
ncbi:hypothetical protein [Methylobacter sp. YRD-M1]|uniref:hypothetical protein n=1 Tax=Methylobacter sp. YRD-M1 TaxID=2911520 RepID=UPI00227BD0E3|nr:hypothetical protein [Methylobacter sp. YRD-M1]WAK01840.1 hypothetical protein LZ558_18805 [Methylobacter sp. YRD-M1]